MLIPAPVDQNMDHLLSEPNSEEPSIYNPQIEMFAHFKTKSSFHETKGII